jgi:hypothetical protein
VTNAGYVPGIALGGSGLVWTYSDSSSTSLWTSDTNGGGASEYFLDGSAMSPGPAKSDSTIFWLEHPANTPTGAIRYTGLDLIGSWWLTVPAYADPSLIDIDATNVYWFNAYDSGIYSTRRNNSSYTNLATAAHWPTAIAVDASYVYWLDPQAGTVNRVPIGGGSVTSVASGQGDVEGLAVDANAIYWTRYPAGSVMKLAK